MSKQLDTGSSLDRRWLRPAIFVATVMLAGSAGSQTGPRTPFVGETTEQFNARMARPRGAEPVLRPLLGETAEDFAARSRGEAVRPANSVVSLAADQNGHFIADCLLNGQRARLVVDTGATLVSLPFEMAQAMGLKVGSGDFVRSMMTAKGLLKAASVRLEQVQIGDILVRDVEAVVMPPGGPDVGLLGMSFLQRLSGFEVSRGRLLLRG